MLSYTNHSPYTTILNLAGLGLAPYKMTSIHKMNMNQVCRACLTPANDLQSMYETSNNETNNLAQLLTRFSLLKCSINDGLPTNLCAYCVDELKRSHAFLLKCFDSDRILRYELDQINENDIGNSEQRDFLECNDDKSGLVRLGVTDEDLKPFLNQPLEVTELAKELEQKIDVIEHEVSGDTQNGANAVLRDFEVKLESFIIGNDVNQCLTNETNQETEQLCAGGVNLGVLVAQSCTIDTIAVLPNITSILVQNPPPVVVQTSNLLALPLKPPDLDKLPPLFPDKTKTSFLCTLCNLSFAQKSCFMVHMRIHAGHDVFTCTVCRRVFMKQAGLSAHMRVHSSEKTYACKHCNAKYDDKVSLLNHKLEHSSKRCPIDSAHRLCVTIETMGGTSVNLYSCTVCGVSFNLKRSLTHPGRFYACTVCGQKCADAMWFVDHLLKHKREQVHQCELCGCRFKFEINLLIHKRKHGIF